MKRKKLLSMVLVVAMLMSVFQGVLPVMGAASNMVSVDASASKWTTVGLVSSDVSGGASFTCTTAPYGTRSVLNTQLDVTEAVEFELKFTEENFASGEWFAIMFGQDASSFNNTAKGTTFLIYNKGDNVISCQQGGSAWRVYTYASANKFRFEKETDGWALYLKGTTDVQLGKVSFDVFPADGFSNNKATFGIYANGANGLTFEVTNVTYQDTRSANVEDLVDFLVDVEEGRDIRVLQLTDTQIINSDEKRYSSALGGVQTDLYNPDAIEYSYKDTVRYVIETLDPDFIILTGDQTYGKFDDSGENHADLVEFIDSFQIPWAPIFGNHEIETNVGADTLCRQYEEAEYCLFKQNTITGNGNYTVGLTQGGELKRVFFMMDSNGTYQASQKSINNGQTKTTWGFANDQVEWYTTVGEAINATAPEAKISFAFHVPFRAVYDALAIYGWEEGGDYGSNPIFIDDVEGKADTDFGFIASAGGDIWDNDYACYNAMKEIGVDSIFVGHIHSTSASIVNDGVRFQFGLKTGVYDTRLTEMADGSYDATHAVGGKPYIGGSAIILSEEDGSIKEAYHIYDDMESDAGDGTVSTLGEPVLEGSFKGYEYTEYLLSDIAGELSSSDSTKYFDVDKDSYSVSFGLTAAENFSLALRMLSNGTSDSGFLVTITNDDVSIVNQTAENGKFSMDFTSGKNYAIEVGAVKMYDGNTYYIYVKVNGEVGAKWRYEETAAYTLGNRLGVKYTETDGEEESTIVNMSTLLKNPDRVQACGFNSDGSYFTSVKLVPESVTTETGVDYTISSHTNGEFYYNGEAEGFSFNFVATQASAPWETGVYNTAANKDYLFVTLRSNGNYAPWDVAQQGYIFLFERVQNGSKTATKVTVYADTPDSTWSANVVGRSSWFDGDLFDGITRNIEISAVNNEENTGVVLRYAVNGKEYFNQTYNVTPLTMENTGIKIVDYVDGGTGTSILYKFTDTISIDIDYTTGKELVESGKLVCDYKATVPVTVTDGWANSDGSWVFYDGEISAVDFDVVFTNTDGTPSEIALYMRANGAGTLWDASQGYIAWIRDKKVTISKTTDKYTAGRTDLVSGTVANIFDGKPHNIKYYAVDADDGNVYGGISIDGGDMITFVDKDNPLSIAKTNFKMVGVNGISPRYKIGENYVVYLDLTDKIEDYRETGTVPEYQDMLFAGWYNEEGKALKKDEVATSYYAKFLPKEVLEVKAQLKLGDGVSANDASGSTEMRLVTTVDDSLDYMEVGFIVTSRGNSKTYTRTTAYDSLFAAGVTVTPDVFHVCSKRFITVNLGNLTWNTDTKPVDREITVQAYWKTYDGTIIYGTARTLTIKQGLNAIAATTQPYSL